MKILAIHFKKLLGGLFLTVALSFSTPAIGQILFTVNDTDPSAVTITGTGQKPFQSDFSTTAGQGVMLDSFFSANLVADQTTISGGGNLIGPGGVSYDTARPDYLSSGNYIELNLYTNGSSADQDFFTSSPAFNTGTLTIDLSAYSADLPAVGTVEDIYAGNSSNRGQIIGVYEVTPEPSTWAMLLGGLSLMAFVGLGRRGRGSDSSPLTI